MPAEGSAELLLGDEHPAVVEQLVPDRVDRFAAVQEDDPVLQDKDAVLPIQLPVIVRSDCFSIFSRPSVVSS